MTWWHPLRDASLGEGVELRFVDAHVLSEDGGFRRASVIVRDGVFATVDEAPNRREARATTVAPAVSTSFDPTPVATAGAAAGREVVRVDASDLWLTPGFVDAHVHLAWRAFDAAERAGRSRALAQRDVRLNARRTLRAGVTTIRDAGGLDREQAAGCRELSCTLSVSMLGTDDARGPAHLRGRVQQLADSGASWVKVLATGGVGAGDRVLEPVFDAAELGAIHAAAERAGLPVMVHAWGGDALTRALEFGAASIEHAVLISAAQARTAATQGTVVVPTVWIYTDVLRLIDEGALPAALGVATRRAVAEHPAAVRRCLDAGVALAMGTEAGLDRQHGRNLHELAALIDAGMPAGGALLAGTAVGAGMLGRPHGGAIVPGAPADLVCFTADPRQPAVLRDRAAVAAVFAGGRLVS